MVPKKMRAAFVHGFRQPLAIDEVPVPEIIPGRVLVKLAACGVCHTDLHAVDGDWAFKPTPPFIPGHEGVGHVVAAGAGVRSLKEGDRVGVPWLHTACGHCKHCLTGWETLCRSQQCTGYTVNGCFADYVLADPDYCGRLPAGLDSAAAAPILCAGVTVYKGLKETQTRPGETVVISGVGGLGHLAVQYAKAMGMHVIAIDVADDKLELARSCGADSTINARLVDPVAEVQKLCGGGEGVLVTAVSRAAYAQAVGMLGRRGTMVLIGLPPGNLEVDILDMVGSCKTIRGSSVGTRADLAEALQFAGEGKVNVHYTTDRLEHINTILGNMRNGRITGRVVLALGE
jgi:alcohol dehydrogenase, propanol-preferring